jgi:RHS repeat-associated protein
MKFTGDISQVQINQQTVLDYALMNDYTYYPSPLISLNSRDYTKHYFIEGQRVMSKIGGGWYHGLISLQEEFDGPDMSERAELISTQLDNSLSCLNLNGEVGYELEYEWIDAAAYQDDEESFYYLYHPDHLGSSRFITDPEGMAIQHLEYLPFGELFIEERDSWNTPYKFSGKELDDETGYSYFGARYYDPNISIWLSVDPLSDEFPSFSPYTYVYNNPIVMEDIDGYFGTRAGAWLFKVRNGIKGNISKTDNGVHFITRERDNAQFAFHHIGTGYEAKQKNWGGINWFTRSGACLLYTSPSPRDRQKSRMPSSA